MAFAASGRVAGLVVLLAVMLAGCASTPPRTPAGPLEDGLTFTRYASGVECDCFEPSVAIAAGKIVVADGYGLSLAVASLDDPGNFSAVPLPPDPPGRGPQVLFPRGDKLVQTAPDGRLFFSKLYIDAFGVVAPVLVLDGLQVASSADGGTTWETNTYVSFRDMPDGMPREQAINPDRQWLGFGPDGEVYLSVNHFAPVGPLSPQPGPWGIYVARSDDGGRTFGSFHLVQAHSDRGGSIYGVAGGIVTAPDGTAYLPLGDHSVEEDGHPSSPSGLMVAVSRDRGETFNLVPVDVAGSAAIWLPRAAYSQGRLVVAWITTDRVAMVASTLDEGLTWTAITLGKAVVGPWVEARQDGGFDVAVSSGEVSPDPVPYQVRLVRIPDEAWTQPELRSEFAVVAGTGLHGGSDFSHLAHLPDGRAVLPWADSATMEFGIALEESAARTS